MSEFEYVSRREALPIKKEIIALIQSVQDSVREYFTLDYRFIGSSSRNMITREKRGNKGYDFDVDLIPNVDDDEYTAAEIRNKIFDAIQHHMKKSGYTKIEDSTSVITINVTDRENSKIEHSCDFAIIRQWRGSKQYIRFQKNNWRWRYSWEYRGGVYDIEDQLQWIKEHRLMQELRDRYLINKNQNKIPEKKSRAIFAETVHNVYNMHNNAIPKIRYSRYAVSFPFG